MARRTVRDEDILAQIPTARRRAQVSHPLAAKARYERAHRRLHVTLTNGATLLVPIDLIASLRRATDVELADVSVGVAGVGLRWERLDEDLSMVGLARVAGGAAEEGLADASGAGISIGSIAWEGRGAGVGEGVGCGDRGGGTPSATGPCTVPVSPGEGGN